MIKKERLEELIKQGATIYEYVNGHIWELELKTDWYVMNNCLREVKLGKHPHRLWAISDLFETKEEAEWHKEFDCVERTERLVLPTWEELFDFDKATRFLDCYTQEFAITKQRSVIGVILFGVDFTNKIIEVSIGSDKLFVEELTKENYTLACRKCKKLFLGDVDDKEST